MELRDVGSPAEDTDGASVSNGRRPRPSPTSLQKGPSMSRGPAPHICEARGHSEADLATCGRLPVRPDLHRPDSVITTSSAVSSEAASVVEEANSALPLTGPPSVYAISGLYGTPSQVSHTPSADTVKEWRGAKEEERSKGHKRSTSSTAASMVMRGAMTHKRSHSHTVTSSSGHRRTGSSGFVMGHRRTTSGALVDTLDKMTGGALGLETREQNLELMAAVQTLEQQGRRKSGAGEEEEESGEEDFSSLRECGYLGCKPACAQPLASIKAFVLLLSVLVTLQQALSSGYLNSVITTIEKRYEIPSSISGIVASMYEVGNVGTIIFVSYLGSRRHIPVFIGTGALLMGFGSLLFSLPHFLSSAYSDDPKFGPNVTKENICKISYQHGKPSILDQLQLGELDSLLDTENVAGLSTPPLVPHTAQFARDDNCIVEASSSSALPIFFFTIAQLLLGIGGSPLFTLGTAYIDNHVARDAASVYIGFMYSMVAFGPVLGFLLGAYLLNHSVDTFSAAAAAVNIDSSSRHWVGMWWGGFLVIGILLLAISLPFFAFPKELKKEKRKIYLEAKYCVQEGAREGKRVEKEDVMSAEQKEKVENYGKNLSDLPACIWKLLTNWVYLASCFGACMELVIVSGFIVFLPKYLETQFNLSKSEASMLTGGTAIPGACIGIFLGGYILKKLQLQPQGAIKLVLIFNLLCMASYGLLFFLGCNNVAMAGATTSYSSNSSESMGRGGGKFEINLTDSCNFGCSCDMNDVQPVCGANGLTYFSPCHAGCTSLLSSDNYTDCACVLPGAPSALHSGVTRVPVATAGPCYTQCQMMLPFMVLLFCMTLCVAVTQMPVLMVVLRSVEEEEKAFALGIQFVIFRIFGYIPSPIIFGNVIDSTCLLWKQTCEGAQGGRCLIYDIEMFRYKYVGICAGIKVLASLIFFLDWWLIRRREREDEVAGGLTVGELVNSVVSLDKVMFEAAEEEAGDAEEGQAATPGSPTRPTTMAANPPE